MTLSITTLSISIGCFYAECQRWEIANNILLVQAYLSFRPDGVGNDVDGEGILGQMFVA
jgi:hypothetical protein